MKQTHFLFITLIVLVLLSSCGATPSPPNLPSATAKAYLTTALDFIEQNSLMSKRIDWTLERQLAFALARNARTTADTYPAIEQVLADLGDHHSSFRTPEETKLAAEGMASGLGLIAVYPQEVVVEVFPSSSAEQAGVQVGDRIDTINGMAANTLDSYAFSTALTAASVTMTLKHRDQAQAISVTLHTGTYDINPPPRGQRLANGLGYVALPQFGSTDKAVSKGYATHIQQIIKNVDQASTCGWVVDLRLERGGDSFVMLAGVGPILGEGEVGSFVDGNGKQFPWLYRNGQTLLAQTVIYQVDAAYHLKRPMPPVAVLTSMFTASAGEAIVVAFRGRPHTMSFGAVTAGVPTGNITKMLSDGAVLVVTAVLDADRTGRTYDSPLLPDQLVGADWTQLGTANDPVLQAATAWLRSQPQCVATKGEMTNDARLVAAKGQTWLSRTPIVSGASSN